jgi:LmbE family N-acetylglucosaminyl deacetylase
MTSLPPTPRRALAIMAHPDDIEFMAGGLMARWAREGTELHYCLLTDGQSGSRDVSVSPIELAKTRRQEQQNAGALLNVASCTFLGQTDGRLFHTLNLRIAVARVIRQVRPDAVVTSDPQSLYSPNYINHPDHRAAGEIALSAIMPVANTYLAAPELAAEGLEPHDVGHVYIARPARPTLWMPIEPQDFEKQLETMQAHRSQIGNWDFADMLRNFGKQAADEARQHGYEYELAEPYVYVKLRDA